MNVFRLSHVDLLINIIQGNFTTTRGDISLTDALYYVPPVVYGCCFRPIHWDTCQIIELEINPSVTEAWIF